MKGLFLTDLYMAMKYCRSYFLLITIFIIVSVAAGNAPMFLIVYPLILSGMLPVTLLSYSERYKWNVYCDTLPVTRKQFVSEKFLLSGGMSLVVFALVAAVQGIRLAGDRLNSTEYSLLLLTGIAASFLSPSITLPCVFKWGIEKGRIIYYVVVGLACGLSITTMEIAEEMPNMKALPQISNWMIGAAILFCIILFAVSWQVSVKVYEKRELG